MQISLNSAAVAEAPVDLVVLGVFAGKVNKSADFKVLDRALDGALSRAVKEEGFTGGEGSTMTVNTLGALRAKRVMIAGVGAESDAGRGLFELAGRSVRVGNRVGAKSVLLALPKTSMELSVAMQLVGRGTALGEYKFDKFLSDKGRKRSVTKVLVDLGENGNVSAALRTALKRGETVATGVAVARDLVNLPAADLYPESYAKRALAEGKKHGFTVKVHDKAALKRMKMGMLMAVGQGSDRPPCLVHMTYTPKGASAKTKSIALVGKGVTFDSGGYSLKPSAAMLDMKIDMGGAASVLGTMIAIAKLKPKVKVHGIATLAENLVSGNAYKLGDVLKAASGRTVEINNTDAEGRLCLGDALHYANEQDPDEIIDLATLTGAVVVALGPYTVGLYSTDDKMANKLLTSSERMGESFWHMPLNNRLKEQLKSDIADCKNTGKREGGSITAALFLSEFVKVSKWAHLDIAGPVSSDQETGATTKGGTGVAVATLVDYVTG
ncbi:MAG: leucyl aminopeptidase [Myxococcota bacterium]